jgi:hypothetical protein
MSALDLAAASLLSPVVLCFVLGAVAVLLRSDLKLPEPVFNALSIYLMLAIGLKGGADLARADLAAVALPALAALGLGLAIPVWTYALVRRVMGFSISDAAALAAHYGSVSAVTFIAVLAYLDATGSPMRVSSPRSWPSWRCPQSWSPWRSRALREWEAGGPGSGVPLPR